MRITRTMVSVMLAVYLGLASAGAQGAVLCVGEDGHLAIEFGCFGESCSTSDTTDIGSSSSQCGSCVDTPLLTDVARTAPQTDRSTMASAPWVFAEAAPFAFQSPAVLALPRGGATPFNPSVILRTNALLI